MSADFSKPNVNSTKTGHLTELNNNFLGLSTWLQDEDPTGIPTNAKRWNSTLQRLQYWNSSAWADLEFGRIYSSYFASKSASIGFIVSDSTIAAGLSSTAFTPASSDSASLGKFGQHWSAVYATAGYFYGSVDIDVNLSFNGGQTVNGIQTTLSSDANKLATASAIVTALGSKEDSFSKNTAFNKDFGTGSGTVCEGNDSRLSDSRPPTAHDNASHSVLFVPQTISVNSGTGLTGGGALSTSRTLSVSFGSSSGTVCQGNDSRLSDARTPVAHDNTYHSVAYISASGVTKEQLDANGDIEDEAAGMTDDDNKIPTCAAVVDYVAANGGKVKDFKTLTAGDSSTRLLLHFDESTFVDSSNFNATINMGDGCVRSSTKSKFGGYSARVTNAAAAGDIVADDSSDYDIGVDEDFELEGWFCPDSYATVQRIFCLGTYGGTSFIGLLWDSNNTRFSVYHKNTNGSVNTTTGTVSVTAGEWIHISVSRVSGTLRFFINGVADTSFSYSGGYAYSPNGDLHIGGWEDQAANNMIGYIDEFRLRIGEGRSSNFTPETSAYTVESSDTTVTDNGQVFFFNDSSALSVDLPNPENNEGRTKTFKQLGSAALTVNQYGSETIDGATSKATTGQYDVLTLFCDGTNWHVLD